MALRSLVIVLGDQLDPDASAFDGFDPAQDAVWMAEAAEESTHVWSAKQRIAVFLSAMRHFAQALGDLGREVHYTRLGAAGSAPGLGAQLAADLERLAPRRLLLTAPGDWRVLQSLKAAAKAAGVPLEVREDRHFFVTVREFAAHAKGRKSLRMEYFYREQRQRHRILLEPDGRPAGGKWNFDEENREAFGAAGPGFLPPRTRHEPDAITREVLALVESGFADHPGRLDSFAWPVTREAALASLEAFIEDRLPFFGRYQDAIWPGDPWLYHSQLSAALNLKLLNPREVVAAAEAAWRSGCAPLASVEGFIRQILGWREYVRGIYWTRMPGYARLNELGAPHGLPPFYWTGETDMACMRDALAQTLEHGYANHIQRLMVTGLYALLYGVEPRQLHEWYLAVYVDAVEWVELPNTLGMSQYGDGGWMASKPYAATGKYIDRMSPHCARCRYEPGARTGERACPFTTMYWDFLMRHHDRLAANPRMALQVKNLERLGEAERAAIRERAGDLRRQCAASGGMGQADIQRNPHQDVEGEGEAQ